jgi:outer membrane lipoprotein-sorting protein
MEALIARPLMASDPGQKINGEKYVLIHLDRSISRILTVALVLGGTGFVSAATDLNEVLVEFDRVQSRMQTISAEFVETNTSLLLEEPIVATGRFYMTKPDAIRWEYSTPEEMRFVISADEYTGYFPSRKKAEKRNIQRWRDQLFRFFGVGQGSTELGKFYNIRLRESDEGSYLLALSPKRRRVKKRVDEVLFWLDAKTYLPQRVEYKSTDGSGRTIEFEKIELNPDLAAGLYQVDLPADVTITDGFSGLSGISTESP